MAVNKVFLIGRLGQEPESRTTPAGHTVCNISLAVSEKYKGEETTTWVKLVFWNKTAEILTKFCKKGSQIFVEGSLQVREWQDKDGNKRETTEVVVRSMQMLDGKPSGNQQNYQQNQQQEPQGDFVEDDILF